MVAATLDVDTASQSGKNAGCLRSLDLGSLLDGKSWGSPPCNGGHNPTRWSGLRNGACEQHNL